MKTLFSKLLDFLQSDTIPAIFTKNGVALGTLEMTTFLPDYDAVIGFLKVAIQILIAIVTVGDTTHNILNRAAQNRRKRNLEKLTSTRQVPPDDGKQPKQDPVNVITKVLRFVNTIWRTLFGSKNDPCHPPK